MIDLTRLEGRALRDRNRGRSRVDNEKAPRPEHGVAELRPPDAVWFIRTAWRGELRETGNRGRSRGVIFRGLLPEYRALLYVQSSAVSSSGISGEGMVTPIGELCPLMSPVRPPDSIHVPNI